MSNQDDLEDKIDLSNEDTQFDVTSNKSSTSATGLENTNQNGLQKSR
jgi:hypothetical protein